MLKILFYLNIIIINITIMFRTTTSNNTSTTSRSIPQCPHWFRPNTGGCTTAQYWNLRMNQDMCNAGTRAGKTCGQCKLRCCFPNCSVRLRKCNLPDGELTCEQIGQHVHDCTNETFRCGLPQRHKDIVRELLLINMKFEPSWIGQHIEKQLSARLNNKEQFQLVSCAQRARSKVREQFEANNVAGLREFVASNKCKEGIDDNETHAANSIVKKRANTLFTSKNMLRHIAGHNHGVAFCMDDTCKMILNDCSLRAMGAVDK